jgi:hypothetical protein
VADSITLDQIKRRAGTLPSLFRSIQLPKPCFKINRVKVFQEKYQNGPVLKILTKNKKHIVLIDVLMMHFQQKKINFLNFEILIFSKYRVVFDYKKPTCKLLKKLKLIVFQMQTKTDLMQGIQYHLRTSKKYDCLKMSLQTFSTSKKG